MALSPGNFREYASKITFGSHTNYCDFILAEYPFHYPLVSTDAGFRLQANASTAEILSELQERTLRDESQVHTFVSRKTGKEVEGQLLAQQGFVPYPGTLNLCLSFCGDKMWSDWSKQMNRNCISPDV